MSFRAYAHTQQDLETPSMTEYRALAKVTGKMAETANEGGQKLIEACFDNNKLWNIFQADLIHPENRLPENVKAGLISLSMWVQRYTDEVMAGRASVQPLIQVNRTIMEGLQDSASRNAPSSSFVEVDPESARVTA